MDNIKTAGALSYLIDGLKGLWQKTKNFFDNKQQFKHIILALKKQGYNIDASKIKTFEQGNKKYIDTNGEIFLIAEESQEKIFGQYTNLLINLLDNTQSNYPITKEMRQAVIDKFDEYYNKLETIKIDEKITLIAIK